MKKNLNIRVLLVLIICLIIISCKKNEKYEQSSIRKAEGKGINSIKIAEDLYSEEPLKIESDFKENDKIKKVKIVSSSIFFLIKTINEDAYLNVGGNKKEELSSWHYINFNFSYETSFEEAIRDIHLLTKKDQSSGYLMFPSTTEQYATYHLYKYSQDLIEYVGLFEDDSFGSFKGKFIYNETQHDLYIQNGAKKIRRLKLLNVQSDNIPANIIEKENKNIAYSYDVDLDKDGIKDKIILYKNDEEKGEFERIHFGLPMEIKKGLPNNTFQTWYENDNIIPENNFNCATEGFSTIVFKDNYFTIENQICSDYILISSYTTFKVIGKNILLHKYGETYFDKADHDRKIPSSTWTQKDFYEVGFENVTEDFLMELRQTKPIK